MKKDPKACITMVTLLPVVLVLHVTVCYGSPTTNSKTVALGLQNTNELLKDAIEEYNTITKYITRLLTALEMRRFSPTTYEDNNNNHTNKYYKTNNPFNNHAVPYEHYTTNNKYGNILYLTNNQAPPQQPSTTTTNYYKAPTPHPFLISKPSSTLSMDPKHIGTKTADSGTAPSPIPAPRQYPSSDFPSSTHSSALGSPVDGIRNRDGEYNRNSQMGDNRSTSSEESFRAPNISAPSDGEIKTVNETSLSESEGLPNGSAGVEGSSSTRKEKGKDSDTSQGENYAANISVGEETESVDLINDFGYGESLSSEKMPTLDYETEMDGKEELLIDIPSAVRQDITDKQSADGMDESVDHINGFEYGESLASEKMPTLDYETEMDGKEELLIDIPSAVRQDITDEQSFTYTKDGMDNLNEEEMQVSKDAMSERHDDRMAMSEESKDVRTGENEKLESKTEDKEAETYENEDVNEELGTGRNIDEVESNIEKWKKTPFNSEIRQEDMDADLADVGKFWVPDLRRGESSKQWTQEDEEGEEHGVILEGETEHSITRSEERDGIMKNKNEDNITTLEEGEETHHHRTSEGESERHITTSEEETQDNITTSKEEEEDNYRPPEKEINHDIAKSKEEENEHNGTSKTETEHDTGTSEENDEIQVNTEEWVEQNTSIERTSDDENQKQESKLETEETSDIFKAPDHLYANGSENIEPNTTRTTENINITQNYNPNGENRRRRGAPRARDARHVILTYTDIATASPPSPCSTRGPVKGWNICTRLYTALKGMNDLLQNQLKNGLTRERLWKLQKKTVILSEVTKKIEGGVYFSAESDKDFFMSYLRRLNHTVMTAKQEVETKLANSPSLIFIMTLSIGIFILLVLIPVTTALLVARRRQLKKEEIFRKICAEQIPIQSFINQGQRNRGMTPDSRSNSQSVQRSHQGQSTGGSDFSGSTRRPQRKQTGSTFTTTFKYTKTYKADSNGESPSSTKDDISIHPDNSKEGCKE